MKPLRCISTAALLCLLSAAPAAAAEVNLSLSSTSTILGGTPITATVSGKGGTTSVAYGVFVMDVGWEGTCSKEALEHHGHYTYAVNESESNSFNVTDELPFSEYEAPGTYQVCAEAGNEAGHGWASVTDKSFTVFSTAAEQFEAEEREKAAAKHKAEEEAQAAARHKAEEEALIKQGEEKAKQKAEAEAKQKATVVCKVPNVKGKKLAAAEKAITSAHCKVGKVKKANSKHVNKGSVISESPGAGKSLPSGTKVSLVVSNAAAKKGARHS